MNSICVFKDYNSFMFDTNLYENLHKNYTN